MSILSTEQTILILNPKGNKKERAKNLLWVDLGARPVVVPLKKSKPCTGCWRHIWV